MVARPGYLPKPFADLTVDKNVIPENPPPGFPGNASLDTGFPPITKLPSASGGLPPLQEDFNGAFYQLYQFAQWQQIGGQALWDVRVDEYPVNTIVFGSNGIQYQCIQANGSATTAEDPVNDIARLFWKLLSGEQDFVVNDIASLRLISGGRSAKVLGYYTAGDGGGGPTRIWDEDQIPGFYVDNGGSKIVPDNGSAAWIWEHTGDFYAEWFGASTLLPDNTDIVQNCSNYLNSTPLSSRIKIGGGTFNFLGSIDPGNYFNLEGVEGKTILEWNEGTGNAFADPSAINLFKNSTLTKKDSFILSNIILRGTKTSIRFNDGGCGVYLENYSKYDMEKVRFEDTSFMAMSCHFADKFRVTKCEFENISRDSIRARDCSDVEVTFNKINRGGDDAIAIHTTVANGVDNPSQNAIVTDNFISMAFSVKVLGYRNIKMERNFLLRMQNHAIIMQTVPTGGFPEGQVPPFNVSIIDNTVQDTNNAYNNTSPASTIEIDGLEVSGDVTTNNTPPDFYDNISGGFIYPWDYRKSLQAVGQVNIPCNSLQISGNKISRSLPTATNYSDWGYGTPLDLLGGEIDPAVTDLNLTPINGIKVSGSFKGINIIGNDLYNIDTCIELSGLTDSQNSINGLNIERNNSFDCFSFLSASSPVGASGRIIGNTLRGDVYRRNANSNINGTYLVLGGPVAITSAISGLYIDSNTFEDFAQIYTGAGGKIWGKNTLIANPVAAGFSTGNAGIGFVDAIGNRFVILQKDCDPTSATYGDIINVGESTSTDMPTTGFYVRSVIVEKNNISLSGIDYITGWLRLTSGSAHVLGTDWKEILI